MGDKKMRKKKRKNNNVKNKVYISQNPDIHSENYKENSNAHE